MGWLENMPGSFLQSRAKVIEHHKSVVCSVSKCGAAPMLVISRLKSAAESIFTTLTGTIFTPSPRMT